MTAFDGMRACAFLSVFLFHSAFYGAHGGWIGVDVFFVLSGFLITTILLTEHQVRGGVQLGRFWLRRLVRLYPALVLAVVLAFTLSVAFSSPDEFRWSWATVALLYLGDFYRPWHGQMGVLSPTWTLAVEEQFYLVWPLVLVGCRTVRRVLVVALVGVVLSLVVFWLLGRPYGHITEPAESLPFARGWELLVGCALAAYLHGRSPKTPMVRTCAALGPAAVVAALGIGVVLSDEGPRLALQAVLAVTGTAVTIVAIVGDAWPNRVLAMKPLPAIGRITYGAYLYHSPVGGIIGGGLLSAWGTFATPMCLVITMGLAWLSYRYVEKPLLQRFGSKHERKVPIRSVDPSASSMVDASHDTRVLSSARDDAVDVARNKDCSSFEPLVTLPEESADAMVTGLRGRRRRRS